jgi:hypothetical protein
MSLAAIASVISHSPTMSPWGKRLLEPEFNLLASHAVSLGQG